MTDFNPIPAEAYHDGQQQQVDTIQVGDWLIEHAHAPMTIVGTAEMTELHSEETVMVRHRMCKGAECVADPKSGQITCPVCDAVAERMYYDAGRKRLTFVNL